MQQQNLKAKNVLIMASGNGSNFEAIVKYFQSKGFLSLLLDKTCANITNNPQSLTKPDTTRISNKTGLQKNTQKRQNLCVNFTLIVDNKDAHALKRAEKLGIPAHYVNFDKLYEFLSSIEQQDLYVLAGYMRILPEKIHHPRTAPRQRSRSQGQY